MLLDILPLQEELRNRRYLCFWVTIVDKNRILPYRLSLDVNEYVYRLRVCDLAVD